MDAIFRFEEQEFVSEPIVLREFFHEALRERDSMRFFGAHMGEKQAWKRKFVPWLQRMNLVKDTALPDIKELVQSVARTCRHATKQYNYDKDDGRAQMSLNKRTRLRCINILQELNAKRKNPHYKSLSLRSMIYDKYDANVLVRSVRESDFEELPEDINCEASSVDDETSCSSSGAVVKSEPIMHGYASDSNSSLPKTFASLPSEYDSLPTLTSNNLPMYNPYEDLQHEPCSTASFSEEFFGSWSNGLDCNDGSPASLPSNGLELEPGWSQCPDIDEFEQLPSFEYPISSVPYGFSSTPVNTTGPAGAHYAPTISENSWQFEGFMSCNENNCEFEEGLPDLTRESRLRISGYAEVKDLDMRSPPLQQPMSSGENKEVVFKKEEEATGTLPNPRPLQHNNLQPLQPYSFPSDENNIQRSFPDDIVVEIAIFIGYPRPLEKHEIRLGRLMKVLDRFLVLGSNTLMDLKKVIDCTSDYQVLEDVSNRSVTCDDLCKNRFPSSYFFIHDTFYIDLQTKGAKDITVDIRRWASERKIADMNMADMSATKIVDLTCRFGAPYLYNHVGACEHLVVITRACLRDASHPDGPYPVPIYEGNFRRIACAGCKEETAEWVVWEHECMPSFTQFLCDPCYKEFNYDVFGKKMFDFKAAPCYDRRNRRAGPVELKNIEGSKENVPFNAETNL
ncbi:hypothetical protein Y032_0013g2084 [Ancylostoma ceylanicum]|nr:hypothetical protein Y032_0013g2084 [Ancylostoma ceylanicum]